MALPDKLGCFGYFGFGAGWKISDDVRRGRRAPGEDGAGLKQVHPHTRPTEVGKSRLYCSGCAIADACWQAHRERIQELQPGPTGELERYLERFTDPERARWEFMKDHRIEPYMYFFQTNLQDGSRVRVGKRPHDRGDLSLSWPLEPLRVQ